MRGRGRKEKENEEKLLRWQPRLKYKYFWAAYPVSQFFTLDAFRAHCEPIPLPFNSLVGSSCVAPGTKHRIDNVSSPIAMRRCMGKERSSMYKNAI